MRSTLKPMTVNEESVGFYYELGRAITSWAHVELALFWIASTAINKSARKQVGLAFFSIDAFHNKLKVADRLFKSKHESSKHKAKWPPLRQKLETLSTTRNNLAHYTVMNYVNDLPGRRIALIPKISTPSKFKQRVPKPPSEALCVREIIYARKKFVAAAFELESLYYNLIHRKWHFPESAAQAGNAPTQAEVTSQIRSMLGRL